MTASPAQSFDRLEPEPLLPETAKQAPFPTDALGPILANAVQDIGTWAFVPHSLAAQSVLSACSLVAQPHFDVVLPTGQVRPISLFFVTVAESGDRKSTSDDAATFSIRDFESELEDQYTQDKVTAALQQSAWDEAKRATTQQFKNKGRDALESAYRDLGPRPDGPIEPTIIVRSGTTQGLLKRFVTTRPSLGLMSDEGGSWLGGYGMTEDNRLATISTLSDFWDGKTVQIMTAGEGYTALRGRRLTFHMMVQPIVAGRLLGDAEAQGQGFLSRLLVSHPESLAGMRIVDPENIPDVKALPGLREFQDRIARIVRADLPTIPDTTSLQPKPLHMTEQARQMWWAFYNSIERRLGPDGDLQSVKGFVGKLPEMAGRLAGNIAVFEHGHRAIEIDAETLARGIALAEFYLSEALRLFGQQKPNKIYEDAQTLSDWLRDKWDENLISVTAISRNGPSALRSRSDYLREILGLLERHNHVVSLPNGGEVSGRHVRQAWRVIVRKQA